MKIVPWWNVDEKIFNLKKIKNCNISIGNQTNVLEKKIKKLLKIEYCLFFNNGTSAMLAALMSMNFKCNHTILIPNIGWISIINCLKILGLKYEIINFDEDKYEINKDAFLKIIKKKKIKCFIPIYMNGRSGNYIDLINIAKRNKVRIIEDAAQVFYQKNKNGNFLGTFGDIGVFSCAYSKLLTSGQGGFAVTSSKSNFEILKKIRNQGLNNIQEISKWGILGFNFKPTDIQASLGLISLSKLKINKYKIKKNYNFLKKNLLPSLYIKSAFINKFDENIYNEFFFKKRNLLQKFLKKKGFNSRLFYPDLSTAFSNKKKHNTFSKNALQLPSGPELSIKKLKKLVNIIKKFYKIH